MDDHADGAYSRAPHFEDLVALCRSLNREQVRYVLIGGFAVALHGSVRTTKDIDLLVDTSAENLQAIKRALADLPDNAVREVEDTDVQAYGVVRVCDEIVVDLLGNACGVDYNRALRDVQRMNLDGVEVPLASKELLIETKNTYRAQDRNDVAYLRARIAEESDGRR